MRTSSRLVLVTALALAAAIGCGKPATAPVSAPLPPLDACTLFELEDADPGDHLGLARVKAPIDIQVGQESAKCSYGTPSPPIMLVSLEVRRLGSAERARKEQKASEGMLDMLSGVEPSPVNGLGDRATWAGGRLGQLHVLFGNVRLIVTVEVGDESGREARARAIAERAIERLQALPSPTKSSR